MGQAIVRGADASFTEVADTDTPGVEAFTDGDLEISGEAQNAGESPGRISEKEYKAIDAAWLRAYFQKAGSGAVYQWHCHMATKILGKTMKEESVVALAIAFTLASETGFASRCVCVKSENWSPFVQASGLQNPIATDVPLARLKVKKSITIAHFQQAIRFISTAGTVAFVRKHTLGLHVRPKGGEVKAGDARDPLVIRAMQTLGLASESSDDRTAYYSSAKALNCLGIASAQYCIDALKANVTVSVAQSADMKPSQWVRDGGILGLWYHTEPESMENVTWSVCDKDGSPGSMTKVLYAPGAAPQEFPRRQGGPYGSRSMMRGIERTLALHSEGVSLTVQNLHMSIGILLESVSGTIPVLHLTHPYIDHDVSRTSSSLARATRRGSADSVRRA
eukprot:6466130-Amphidinium_carterae.1